MAETMAPAPVAHGSHEPVPTSTNSVGATSASMMVAVPRIAPATSMGSRCRSSGSSAAMPLRMQANANPAIGTFTSRRTCHGANDSTNPPTVGPIASPPAPPWRSRSSHGREARRHRRGGKPKQATRVSCSAVTTNAVERLAAASSTRPMSMILRRPTRSARALRPSISPPKTTAYALVTNCNADVDACRSRPMVGSATLRIELSSISNRNTAERPARATHASRSDRGGRAALVAAVSRSAGACWRGDIVAHSFKVKKWRLV